MDFSRECRRHTGCQYSHRYADPEVRKPKYTDVDQGSRSYFHGESNTIVIGQGKGDGSQVLNQGDRLSGPQSAVGGIVPILDFTNSPAF